MKISRAISRQEAVHDQQPRVCSKKPVLSLSKGPSSPVLRPPEGKAAAIFARGAYWYYVSTEKWRERRWRLFSTGSIGKCSRTGKVWAYCWVIRTFSFQTFYRLARAATAKW